jgi:hypothetical protein
MASGIDYKNLPQNSKLATQALDIEKKDKELARKLGYIGKIFGHGNNVVLYVVALITIFLVLIGAIYSFCPINETNMKPVELWKTFTPFITTGLGFIAGKSGKIESE